VNALPARNDKIRMSNVECCRGVCVKRLINPFRAHRGKCRSNDAFTLIELIVVATVVVILTGLVLSTVGYVQKKGARARAETEIAAISASCENYKADNGVYPNNNDTNALDAKTNGDPGSDGYTLASLYLYKMLSGDSAGNRSPTEKSYMVFKPNMLLPAGGGAVTAIADPFGNSYGYSTANQADPNKGYNPTFDLWSTCGLTTDPPSAADQNQWIKNW
jgi:prepilin-type N-terminal cleavage/methylation domain-containing protein